MIDNVLYHWIFSTFWIGWLQKRWHFLNWLEYLKQHFQHDFSSNIFSQHLHSHINFRNYFSSLFKQLSTSWRSSRCCYRSRRRSSCCRETEASATTSAAAISAVITPLHFVTRIKKYILRSVLEWNIRTAEKVSIYRN